MDTTFVNVLCLSCKGNRNLIPTQQCICPNGYYNDGNDTCPICEPKCLTCVSPGNVCITCKGNRDPLINCGCPIGTY